MKPLYHKWHGTVNQGRFQPEDVGYFGHLSALSGKRVFVAVEPFRKARSGNQNRYLWLLYGIIGDHIGDDPDSVHRSLAARHLVENPGEPLPKIRSTTDLSTVEMTDYIERIKRDGAEGLFGAVLYLPEPGDIYQQ